MKKKIRIWDIVLVSTVGMLGVFYLALRLMGIEIVIVEEVQANTTQVTASVQYNNCNMHTTHIPAPTDLTSYDWGFTAYVGDSFFYGIRSGDTMYFFLDEASWSYSQDEGLVYKKCGL